MPLRATLRLLMAMRKRRGEASIVPLESGHVLVACFRRNWRDVPPVVDHVIGTEASHEIEVPHPGRRGHPGASPAGELDGEAAHAAGWPVDQHLLPRDDPGAVDQPLPRREGGDGRDRRASVSDGRRIPGDVGGSGQARLRLRPRPRKASGQSSFAASSGTVTLSASRGCRITARRRVFALALGFLVTRWTHPDGS
jgi:hypothetical protein